MVVSLSTRLMPLFGPSTTFECVVTDSVPPRCDVQVNESVTIIYLIVGSILMVTVVGGKSGISFQGDLN